MQNGNDPDMEILWTVGCMTLDARDALRFYSSEASGASRSENRSKIATFGRWF
jgi:hypothetical protein